MRREIGAMRLEHGGKLLGTVTAFFSVAVFPQHAADAEALVRSADQALYEAKHAGRNRVLLTRAAQSPALAA